METFINNIKKYFSLNNKLDNYTLSYDDIDIIKNIKLSEYKIKKNKYVRNLLYRDNNFEILLLAWDKDSSTPTHNHPKNGCVLYLIDGKLKEKRISDHYSIDSIIYKNKQSYIDDSIGKHKIEAMEKSYSIHIYSPPNFYS